MNILLNNEPRKIEPCSLLELVAQLGLNPKNVAIERNRAIVPRSLHGETLLSEGDRIEIVQFIGGG